MITDWKVLAPKRADWERFTAEFEAAGLPRPTWLNGVPNFGRELTAKDDGLVRAIAAGTTPTKAKKALADDPGPVHQKKGKKHK